jgi:autotransporter-associated beta strand protein
MLKKVLFSLALLVLLAVAPSPAAQVTWDGDTNSDLYDGNNWVGDAAPVAGDDVVFPGGLTSGASVTPTVNVAATSLRSITYGAGAPQYTFTSTLNQYELLNPSADVVINNSSNTQIFHSVGLPSGPTGALINGYLNAASGALVINAPIRVGSGLTGGGNFLAVAGSQDIYFNVDSAIHAAGNLAGGEWTGATPATTMVTSNRSRFFMDFYSGTAYLGDIGTSYVGTFHLNSVLTNGALRLTHNNSLGGTTSNSGVVIWGGDPDIDDFPSNATLELDGSVAEGGGISVARPLIYVDGRLGSIADDPHIRNVTGNNTITASTEWRTGHVGAGSNGASAGNINLQSDGGKITIAGGTLANRADPGGDVNLNLRGVAEGEIQSQITVVEGIPSFNVIKKDGGTWTLSNAANDYTGSTIIEAGTLSLGSTGVLAGTSTIEVHAGATLDVSEQTALVLGSVTPQVLKGDGTVDGSVTLSGGSTLEVDYTGSLVPGLSITGTLDITGAIINFNHLGGSLSAGAYVFATYGALVGNPFTTITDLPSGFAIDYQYEGNQIALVTALPGDFNADGNVNGDDFALWQMNFPTTSGANLGMGDGDGDGDVDGADFVIWQTNFPMSGSAFTPVPEPAGLSLIALAGLLSGTWLSRCKRNRCN